MFSLQFALFLLCMSGVWGLKNVLFFASDDMRPQINAYMDKDMPDEPKMHTPNLDKLAGQSLLLKKAYVQQAVCSPSRASLLTGRRPDTTHVTDLIHYWRNVGGNFTTIPQYFSQNGYTTAGMGKIFHPGAASGDNDPVSWTEPYFHDKNYYEDIHDTWTAFPDEQLDKKPLQDMQLAEHAVKMLKNYSTNNDKPFFLAVGFRKPHLPFQFPESFLDFYPEESIHVPSNQYAPSNMPPIAWSDFDEIRSYNDILYKYGFGNINTTFPDKLVKELRRGYYATISYVDAQLGKVMSALNEYGLADDTIVSFWGDHGWQLGEHGEWCKHTNFELSTHAPMMVRVPGLTDEGLITEQLTEFVDLFPTLAEAAGLPRVPLCPEESSDIELCTEGQSFVPLMRDPQRQWKSASFSQYPRMDVAGNAVMGYTMRTQQYRYTEWVKFSGIPDYQPMWSKLFKGPSIELYDHEADPYENANIALDPKNAAIVKQLSEQLHDGWRKARPREFHAQHVETQNLL